MTEYSTPVRTYRVGQEFKIGLASNPTTGYQWSVEVTDGLSILESRYETSCRDPGVTGCGGTSTWKIRAIKPGRQTFVGWYERPWMPRDPEPTEVLVYNVI